ncbi:MAG: FeoB-associated Cys-rich membrane protein [Lachnospiraceae bacterium]|nr:FeoB-associated Cys-rich membrane protein [Lachnospiraceae bacterium]
MLAWLSANLGTIIITLVLIAIVAFVIFIMVRDKKKGKSSCGGNCAHCKAACSHKNDV